jgi:hypothetical protein
MTPKGLWVRVPPCALPNNSPPTYTSTMSFANFWSNVSNVDIAESTPVETQRAIFEAAAKVAPKPRGKRTPQPETKE